MESDRIVLVVLALVGLIAVISILTPFGGYMMMGPWFSSMFFLMTLVWMLVIVALMLFILWLIQQLTQTKRRQHG